MQISLGANLEAFTFITKSCAIHMCVGACACLCACMETEEAVGIPLSYSVCSFRQCLSLNLRVYTFSDRLEAASREDLSLAYTQDTQLVIYVLGAELCSS